MRRILPILLILLSTPPATVEAGWFGPDKAEIERDQRIQAEERLKAAQQRLNTEEQRMDGQDQTISRLRFTNTLAIAAAFLLLIIGVAMGTTTKRNASRS